MKNYLPILMIFMVNTAFSLSEDLYESEYTYMEQTKNKLRISEAALIEYASSLNSNVKSGNEKHKITIGESKNILKEIANLTGEMM